MPAGDIFTTFFADMGDGAFFNFNKLLEIGNRRTADVDKDAYYTVICDQPTSCYLPLDVEKYIVEHPQIGMPLMLRELHYQTQFLQFLVDTKWSGGICVMASPDCFPNRQWRDALHPKTDFGVTIRGDHVINVVYVRNAQAALAFFQQCFEWLNYQSEADLKNWGGDQEAMSELLGPNLVEGGFVRTSNEHVQLLPCKTHLYTPPRDHLAEEHFKMPYVIHFKGDRKTLAVEYAKKHFGIGDGR